MELSKVKIEKLISAISSEMDETNFEKTEKFSSQAMKERSG